MSSTTHKAAAITIILAAIAIGTASLTAFLFFLYSGALNKAAPEMSDACRLAVDALLSVVFFLQHSLMVRKTFRRRLDKLVPAHYHGAMYTLASGVVLLMVVIFWQGAERIVLEVHGLPGKIMRGFFFLALLGMGWGSWALRAVDMFGLDPIVRHLRKSPVPPTPFTVRGPHRWVRHPLYFFMIVLFWSCPVITADRLLFNILWTAWVIVGTILEERDLVEVFGDRYRAYQERVPMLLPRSLRPAYPPGEA